MILTYLSLGLGFVLPYGSIAWDMARDYASVRDGLDIARITAPLPARRRDLSQWPAPLSPLDLPGIGHTAELDSRARYRGRHRIGTAVGAPAQVARWNSPTGQFWLIVDQLGDLSVPCAHCVSPEDGEPAHAGCPGCSCPCGLVEATG